MQANEPQNISFNWCTHFVRTLHQQGVRHVVISPGSRSTPLTLAFAAHPGFTKTIVIDERSAAFIALGQAKAKGIPSVLVCTSGTALANYAPAVFEAKNSGIPLIIASADRPPHSRNVGSSQTIDQLKIFGDHAVFFHDAGEPSSDANKLKRIETAAIQSVYYSQSKTGVAHINFPFDKPLEPTAEFLNSVELKNSRLTTPTDTDYNQEFGETSFGDNFWSQLISAEKPVIMVGPLNNFDNLDFILPLAKKLNAPLLVEPGANIPTSKHHITGYTGFLKNEDVATELAPDLIIRCGAYPITRAAQTFLERNKDLIQIQFMHLNIWQDGDVFPDKHIVAPSNLHIPDITGNAQPSWLKAWKKAESKFKTYREDAMQPSTPLTDGYVFTTLSKLIPKNSFTMLSNSFPVRDLALFTDYTNRETYVNRGAAGIDGITSTTIGLSQTLNKTGVLFIGDIAFLHDSNALLSKEYVKKPLVIVLLNNGGGTIFRMLPIYEHKEKHREYFETPQSVRIVSLCRAYEIGHTLVTRPEQLVTAFEEVIEKDGIHVIECLTDADNSMLERHKLWNFENEASS
ncbi:MAG: 2-succinyl-5-enolpyruvyl-6-hydroxy-3-cyclohexene-1-carboxylic-acid synthase [Balneolaceae bacterium]